MPPTEHAVPKNFAVLPVVAGRIRNDIADSVCDRIKERLNVCFD